jgi:ABC-type phosphate/phosphonate transport system ATPase subunit
MGTDKALRINHGHVVFVGSKGSGKSSLYQCLKSPNPQVIDGLSCSVLVEDWRPFSNESPGKVHSLRFLVD